MILSLTQTVSSKGQFVIPAKIRKTLGIIPGTKLILTVDESEKKFTAKPAPKDPIKAALGALRKPGEKDILKEMLQEKQKEIKHEDRWPF